MWSMFSGLSFRHYPHYIFLILLPTIVGFISIVMLNAVVSITAFSCIFVSFIIVPIINLTGSLRLVFISCKEVEDPTRLSGSLLFPRNVVPLC